MKPQLLIGGMSPGSGKSLFTSGLSRLLSKRGLHVQDFKCGSDFVDAKLLELASGNPCFHLDLFVTSSSHVQHVYNKYGERADVCLIEGQGGLFDGYDRINGSSAQIAEMMKTPVLLVVNARASSYSISASIYGFKHYHPMARIIGVVFTQVVSSEQFVFLRKASQDAGVKCFGFIPYDERLRLPSKHSCYTNTLVQELGGIFDLAASYVEKYVDVENLFNSSQRSFPVSYSLPYKEETDIVSYYSPKKHLRIAVADDPAFGLTYQENLVRLSQIGEICRFSPVYGSDLPQADIVFLPGGYPELFARQLYRRRKIMEDLRNFAEAGGKILAEDGGMILLSQSLSIRDGGTAYPMAGILPLVFTMTDKKIQSGYRQISDNGLLLKGYEFHYTEVQDQSVLPCESRMLNPFGNEVDTPFIRYKNIIASYSHLYLGETDILKLWD